MPGASFQSRATPSLPGRIWSNTAIFAALLIVCGIWYHSYMTKTLNTDLAWLFTCASRWLDGGNYRDDFFETNPPLSILLQVPAVFIYRFFHISVHSATFYGTCLYLLIFLALLYAVTARHPAMTAPAFRRNFFVGAFLASTCLSGDMFGQKDMIIFWGLCIFCLQQSHYLLAAPAGKTSDPLALRIICGLCGALAVAIKPHYIIIPFAMIGWRFFQERNLKNILRCPELWCFPLFGAAYIASIYIFFPEFLHDILPAVRQTYILQTIPSMIWYSVIVIAAYFFTAAFLFICDKSESESHQNRYILAGLYGGALICLLPFFEQAKGFFYHLLPVKMPLEIFIFIALNSLLRRKIKSESFRIAAAILLLYLPSHLAVLPFSAHVISEKQVVQYPAFRKIKELAKNGRYDQITLYMPPYNDLPYLLGLENTSRFSQNWVLYGLLQDNIGREIPDKKILIGRQIGYIAEDITRHTPSLIVVSNPPGQMSGTFITFLIKNDAFKGALSHYRYDSSATLDDSIFFPAKTKIQHDNLVTLDFYVLKDEK